MPANTCPALAAHDLRSEARSYQRDKAHTTKWALGAKPRTGVKCNHLTAPFNLDCTECLRKPASADGNTAKQKQNKMSKKKANGQATTLARKAFRGDLVDAFDGPLAMVSDTTSSDDEVQDASAAPLPAEADFMYNYDKSSGPAGGRDIFSSAITKAVQRFENTETEKLVTREYDVIDEAKEGYTADEDDDDFELIDHSHLN